MSASTAIGAIQTLLEQLYELDPGYAAEQFLVSRRELLPAGSSLPHDPPEQLLLCQQDGDLLLTLYLSESLLRRLEEDSPLAHLHPGNLADLCLAIEGVSHFLYVVCNARYERPVTQLELELQAEIDKFMLSALLYDHQRQGGVPRGLHRRLFRQIRFAEPLRHHQRQRYHRANSYAASYCRYLHGTYLAPGGMHRAERELRRFYRLMNSQKIRHIESRTRHH